MNILEAKVDKRLNKVAVNLYSIIAAILSLAYLIQALKGQTPMWTFAIIIVTLLVPLTATWIVKTKNNESALVKHMISLGYGLFYLSALLFIEEQQAYTYALPMLLLVTVYDDFKLTRNTDLGVMALAVIHAVRFGISNDFSAVAVPKMEIEIAVMIIFCLFSLAVNRNINKMNLEKQQAIKDGAEKTSELLNKVLEVSAELTSAVAEVSDKMTDLSASSEETLASMHEVQQGTNDSANSIQNQLYKTEEIQNQVEKVTEASGNIENNIASTVDAVREGRGYIEKLIDQSKISAEGGAKVGNEVAELKDATSKMTQIVELIKNVASQTSLLALNASIEAARAGEAGRGFAVVASEISNLAGQTQDATGSISELIEGISQETEEVISAIDSLIESNRIQNESAEVTAESFEKIADNIREIRDNSNALTSIVENLAKANQEIVESVQTVSAITEEVTAHASTTCEATEQNQHAVENVQAIVERMNRSAAELKALE